MSKDSKKNEEENSMEVESESTEKDETEGE